MCLDVHKVSAKFMSLAGSSMYFIMLLQCLAISVSNSIDELCILGILWYFLTFLLVSSTIFECACVHVSFGF